MGHNIKSPAGRSRKGGTKGTTSPKNDDPTGQNPPRTRSRKNQRHRPWIFLSVIVISLGKCSYLVSAETMTEKEILGSLYDFTNGDSWKVNENWKSDSVGICDWHGITCDPTTNKVTQIGLDRNNLSGSIPPSLWKLASLTQVSVRNNLLTSLSLTEFLTRDPENDPRSPLDTLIAAENHLTNVDGIGNIAATLKHLNINKNHIETSVLDEISSCVNLVTLYIAFNQISGRLSTTIGRLTDLTEIYAFDNRLTGQIPTELGLLDLVQVLGLGNNLFTGTLPTELEQMVNMEDLSIHHVRNEAQGPDTGPSNWGLSGPLLTFGDMPHLSLLFLDGNMFTGTIPSDFLRHNTFTDSPVSVGLTNNKLTGTIPKSLERFESLSIDLVGNLITGIPEELCRKGGWMGGLVEEFKCDAILCSSGTYNPLGRAFGSENPCMRCSSNNFTNLGATTCQVDEGSDDASKPQNGPLKTWEILAKFYLVMAGEKWAIQDGWDTFHGLVGGGTTIAELEKADIDVCNGWYGVICNSDQQVTDISLVNNGLYGVVPDSIFSIPTLQAFDVSNNNVQMITLKGASQAQNLTSLILSNVKIQSIEGIGGMKNLRQLLLDGLNIEAPLTSELFELTNLRTLHLQHGHFTGVIPTQIGQLTELEDLNIYGNDLNGTLPSEIGALIRLRSLDLSENRFAGSIPTEISALAELEVFAIHQLDAVANIGGQIPAFDTFPRLKEVNLEYNELTGTIPTNFLARVADKSSEITLSLGFNRLEGAIPESLNSFAKLILNLEGNRITSIPASLCNKIDWMQGEVGKIANATKKCNAILCPPGSYNDFGKETEEAPCTPCDDDSTSASGDWAFWHGRISCGDISPSREKEILDKLFSATGGRYWNVAHDNWLRPGVPICQREGVECGGGASANEGILELRMNRFGLRGAIPSEIWELSKMRQLAFTRNDIDLSFNGIENAQSLVVLKLSKCHLRTLEGIGKASDKLRELHLAENQFSGTIPEDIFGLDKVQLVYLNNNHFSGTVPTSLAKMTSLTKLEIHENQFNGTLPTELGLLADLSSLEIQLNELSGTVPTEIQTLEKLERLDISQQNGKKFEGAFPAFDKIPALNYIDASFNGFSGPLPPNLLIQVDPNAEITVNLAGNRFEGAVPLEWSRFEALNLELGGNRLTALPESLCQLNGWQKGLVGLFDTCDAILCPPGTQSLTGRQTEAAQSCASCEAGETSAPFFGMTTCLDARLVEEKRILSNFYESTNGTNWLIQTNWLSDGSVCDWHGVLCDGDEHVTEIKLDTNMIEGSSANRDVISEILTLEDLTVLDLKGNEVQLDFTKLPSLTKLEYLRMSGTGMSSMVGLSRGTVLKAFHATNNELRNVPEELFSMVHLESLFLSYNSVTGTISRRFGQMSSLKELYMFGNRLTGSIPSELGRLTDLTELVLAHNYLSGIVPDELSFLPNLEQMSIFDQQGVELITGPVPTFSGASKLWYFDASNNDLTGPMPGNFMMNAASTNASIEIFLRNNEITGTVPAALSRFESLNIDLADNKIMEIPPVLCQIGGWMEGKAQLVGTCNAILCPKGHFNQFGHESPGNPCLPCDNLKDDQYLGKIRCEDFTSERDTLNKIFHESGGEFWSNATNWKTEAPICSWEGVLCENGDLQDSEGITLLRLDNNGLSGTLPSEVWTLPSLRYLSLKNNPNLFVNFDGLENAAETLEVLYLTETGLASLGGISAATRLQELHLTGNDIKGTFPEELFALSNTLQSLYLANNLFYGSLPTKLGKMSNLRAFYAFENNFMSTIPSELGRLKYLKVLVLAENMMYGQIPQELSAMPELEVFAAFRREKSGPRLTGTLPSFDKLPQLKELYLQGNDIHGTVPESFVSASRSIEVIRLGSNILTGTVPGDFGQLPKLNLELEGNMIEGFPASFCLNKDWMEGAIDSYGCNAFLCPPGSASASGRAVNASTTCGICSKEGAAQYYGSTSCDGSLSEREILVNLFYALNGNLWYRNDFWGSTADICDWYGIGCVGGHVVIINLRGNNLQGLPGPDLFHLPELRTIWLYSNPLQFSFENIGSAKKLQDLRLDSTLLHSLHGIGSAKSLISFDAGFTALRGPFPENEILALSNLRNLQLNDNSFSGTLPKSFTQLKFLINLRLDSNRFTGTLPFFDDMHFLEYVDFSNNVLNGPISRKFFGKLALDARPTIRLARNQLTGVIPEEFDRFQDMTVHFSDNQILGLPVVLCDNKKWNNGDVGKYGCDAIMCTPGTSNPQGRRTPNSKCRQCKGASYYGDTSCQSDPSSAVQLQQQLFIIAALLTMTALHFV